ncbi:hypothetical protein AB8B21_05530 [Tardiphaga sp. 866_E4_N2_1]|uniref:hypothetical protein n=1 Tax=unclassified Tardiphaga TaxID=2631404 RepID=UPI003F20949C
MIRAASTPRYSDFRQDELVRYAHGKCRAKHRPDGAKLRWFPQIGRDIVNDSEFPNGHDTNFDAVKRAQEIREHCLELLGEPNGSV